MLKAILKMVCLFIVTFCALFIAFSSVVVVCFVYIVFLYHLCYHAIICLCRFSAMATSVFGTGFEAIVVGPSFEQLGPLLLPKFKC